MLLLSRLEETVLTPVAVWISPDEQAPPSTTGLTLQLRQPEILREQEIGGLRKSLVGTDRPKGRRWASINGGHSSINPSYLLVDR